MSISKEEFVEKFRHEILGMMLDAVVAIRSGAQLAIWCRARAKWTDDKLSAIWDESHADWKPKGAEELADDLLALFPKLSAETQKTVVEKLRVGFNQKKETK